MMRIKAALIRSLYILAYPVLGLILHNSHRVRVLIMVGDEILLQRTSVGDQKWSVPGGGIEKNESEEAAAIRETKEEVGVTINKNDLKKIGWQRVPYKKGWPYLNLTFFQVSLAVKPHISVTRPLEILEADWFSKDNLPKKHSKFLDIALSLLK